MVTRFIFTALISMVSAVSFQGLAHAQESEVDALLSEIEFSGAPEFVPGSLSEDEVRAESGLPSVAECENNPMLQGCYIIEPTSGGETVTVEVSLGLQQLSVYVSGNYVGTYLISSGKPGHGTPTGSYRVWEANKHKRSRKYENAPMPNALAFTPAYHALHCGYVQAKRASHGCVRVERSGCEKLWELNETYGKGAFVVNISQDNPSVVAIEGDNRSYYGQKAPKAVASNKNKAPKSQAAKASSSVGATDAAATEIDATATKKAATKKKVVKKNVNKNQQVASAEDSFEEEFVDEPKPKKKKKKFRQKVGDIFDGFFGADVESPY